MTQNEPTPAVPEPRPRVRRGSVAVATVLALLAAALLFFLVSPGDREAPAGSGTTQPPRLESRRTRAGAEWTSRPGGRVSKRRRCRAAAIV